MRKGKSGVDTRSSGTRELAPVSSLVRHYLFLPGRLLRSHFCVDLHTTRRHKKSWVREYFLPTSPLVPFRILFVLQTKPNPCMEFRKKLNKCIIWGAFNPDDINWHSFVHLRFLKLFRSLVKIHLQKFGVIHGGRLRTGSMKGSMD